jgi:hypothetical protein
LSETNCLEKKMSNVNNENNTTNEDDGEVLMGELIDDSPDPVVPGDTPLYRGHVVSVHERYSFVSHIKRGYETIATNGDVFVPLELSVGATVEFTELNSDPKRPGKFRTESVTVISSGELAKTNAASRAMALMALSEPAPYHSRAKHIKPEEVEKAAENLPFAEMLGIHERSVTEGVVPDLTATAENFLRETFSALSSAGVEYSIKGDINDSEEAKNIDAAKQLYRRNGMDGQITSLEDEYARFSGVRKAFELMQLNGLLSMQSVIPIKYLPDLLVTAPVWFVHSKNELRDLTGKDDPQPDHAVKFFCDQVGTKEFAWLYQIYNRRTRPFKSFTGRDIIPLNLLEIMENAKMTFDYLIIATPYHDIASKEWSDPEWLRNIDPFLIGFQKGLPYMFLLGRWSGTGLFPLMCDMIADTIGHLRTNKTKLGNFKPSTYWYKGSSSGGECLGGGDQNPFLPPFAEKVIEAYEENRLFGFLRGEGVEKIG